MTDSFLIPKCIYQTYDSWDNIPNEMKINIEKMKLENSNYDYKFFNNQDCIHYIETTYGNNVLHLYHSINTEYGASRADLFRYLLIYDRGGIYFDIKSYPKKKLDDIILPSDEYLLSCWHDPNQDHIVKTGFGEFQNWFIIAKPRHPYLKKVIMEIFKKIKNAKKNEYHSRIGVLNLTGPIQYTLSILEILHEYNYSFKRNSYQDLLSYNGCDLPSKKNPIYDYHRHNKLYQQNKETYKHLESNIINIEYQKKLLGDELIISLNKKKKKKKTRSIPNTLYMCCKDKTFIPSFVIKNWKLLNPQLEIILYDDMECLSFIKQHYPEDYSILYQKNPWGPIKAYLWSLCILYKYGGYYVDVDLQPFKSITSFISPSITFITCIEPGLERMFQAFIGTTINSDIIKNSLDIMINKYHSIPVIDNYSQWSGTLDMYQVLQDLIPNFKSQIINNQELFNIDSEKIQILRQQAVKPTKLTREQQSMKNCHIFNINKDKIFKSRYIDKDDNDNICWNVTRTKVLLTVLPERLITDFFQNVITSLKNQTVPIEIYINIPYIFNKTNKPYVIPNWLYHIPFINIIRCQDNGPATKLLGSYDSFQEDDIICIVDDDIIYKNTMIENLLNVYKTNPKALITSYKDNTNSPTGFAGYLFQKSVLKINDNDLNELQNYCYYVDDTWVGKMCKRQDIEIIGLSNDLFASIDRELTDKHPEWFELCKNTNRNKEVMKCLNCRPLQ